MTIYDGWEKIDLLHSQGTNPDSERSIIVYAETARRGRYQNRPYVLISQVITKESLENFTPEEIFPIDSVSYSDLERRGSYGPTMITLKNSFQCAITFEAIEGNMKL